MACCAQASRWLHGCVESLSFLFGEDAALRQVAQYKKTH